MRSYTGLTGTRDELARKFGDEYLVVVDRDWEAFCIGKTERMDVESVLDNIEWMEWVNVTAMSQEEALENYGFAYSQWIEWMNQ